MSLKKSVVKSAICSGIRVYYPYLPLTAGFDVILFSIKMIVMARLIKKTIFDRFSLKHQLFKSILIVLDFSLSEQCILDSQSGFGEPTLTSFA